ncbi:MAG TPA: hypothetical protein VF037_05450 [Gemmatimonadales bacterium]
MRPSLAIGPVATRAAGNGTRVTAPVGGHPAWFECTDLPLEPAPEAFGSAFLIPAAASHRRLDLAEPVSSTWADGAGKVLDTVGRWWGYRVERPRAVMRPEVLRNPDSRRGLTALCFSGGVDSFFTLLRRPGGVDLLVAAHGFDIPLVDVARMSRFHDGMNEVAAELGVRTAVVRTNLREHREFLGANWTRTHGGALAALGHALGGAAERLVVSSSCTRRDPYPWGSHFELDPLWSSGRLTIEHFGESLGRGEKLGLIGNDPLVQRHLRVCWENRSGTLNCSRCEKCIRTEVTLATYGLLDRFEVFASPTTLADRIDGVAKVPVRPSLQPYRTALESGALDHDVARAVRALIRRTRRSYVRDSVVGLARRATARL